jgi:hypothetical protein
MLDEPPMALRQIVYTYYMLPMLTWRTRLWRNCGAWANLFYSVGEAVSGEGAGDSGAGDSG